MDEQELLLKEKETREKGLLQFRTFDKYVKEALVNSEIIFGAAKNFNDPFDSNLPIDLENVSFELIIKFLEISNRKYSLTESELREKAKYYFENKSKLEKTIRCIINDYRRFSCFQIDSKDKTHKDILFWANYADKHKGICLKFKGDIIDAQKHFLVTSSEAINSYPIDYVKSIPKFNYLNYRIIKASRGYDFARKLYGYTPSEYFFAIKARDWKSEKEVRFIFQSPNDLPIMEPYKNIKFNPNVLEKVYIGCNANEDEIGKIFHLPKYQHVKVIKLLRDNKKFKFREERIK